MHTCLLGTDTYETEEVRSRIRQKKKLNYVWCSPARPKPSWWAALSENCCSALSWVKQDWPGLCAPSCMVTGGGLPNKGVTLSEAEADPKGASSWKPSADYTSLPLGRQEVGVQPERDGVG